MLCRHVNHATCVAVNAKQQINCSRTTTKIPYKQECWNEIIYTYLYICWKIEMFDMSSTLHSCCNNPVLQPLTVHAGYEWKMHCLICVSCSAWRHWNECQTNINGCVCLLQLSPVAARLLNVVLNVQHALYTWLANCLAQAGDLFASLTCT